MSELPNHEVVPQIISEIVDLEHEIVAISCIMVMKSGEIKTRLAFTEGQKLRLLAGVTLHPHDLCETISHHPRNFAQMPTGKEDDHG